MEVRELIRAAAEYVRVRRVINAGSATGSGWDFKTARKWADRSGSAFAALALASDSVESVHAL